MEGKPWNTSFILRRDIFLSCFGMESLQKDGLEHKLMVGPSESYRMMWKANGAEGGGSRPSLTFVGLL